MRMNSDMGADPADILARVARHSGWTLAFGILTVVAGVLILFWPRETLFVLAVIFGIQLILSGVGELVDAIAPSAVTHEPRWFVGLMGSLSVVVGIILVRNVFLTIAVVALMLGIYCVIYGLMRVFSAIADRATPARGWTGLLGSISILAGIALLVYPGPTLLYAAIVLGVLLVLTGAIRISAALVLRRMAKDIRVGPPLRT